MDTMDTIPAQQIPSQPAPIIPGPKIKSKLRGFLNISSWMFLFTLLPITILIFLSQDAIPGGFFYPVKRGIEGVILAAASISPATRAAFSMGLTETRFTEAQSLVISQSNTSGLSTFADDVQSAQIEISNLKNETERKKAEEKLSVKIQEYQKDLSVLEAKTEQTIIAYQFQEIPTSTPLPAKSDSASFGGSPTIPPTQNKVSVKLPSPSPFPSPTLVVSQKSKITISPQIQISETAKPILVLTPTPTPASPVTTNIPTGFLSLPIETPTSAPALILSPTVINVLPTVVPQQENTQIAQQRKIAEAIRETKITLDKIKKDLNEKKEENKNIDTQNLPKNNEEKNQDQNKDTSDKKPKPQTVKNNQNTH